MTLAAAAATAAEAMAAPTVDSSHARSRIHASPIAYPAASRTLVGRSMHLVRQPPYSGRTSRTPQL
eukprot:1455911-Prymnesium_polylepis.1